MYTPVGWPLPDLVSRQATMNPDRPAMVDAATGEAWTFGELDDGPVAAYAAGIRSMGLDPGDHLGVVSAPGIEVGQLVHGAARAGVTLVPLPPDAPAPAIRDRCSAADVDGVAVAATAVDRLEGLDVPRRPLAALRRSTDDPPAHRWRHDDVQWLVFTSGTTGDPRPVALTAGNLVASATASALRLGVEPGDRWLACLPMHHVGGLAPVVRTALYGTAAVVQPGFEVDATAKAMDDEAVTAVSLVPTMLSRLLDAGWRPPPTLRFVLLGGAPADQALIERCGSAGVPVHPTYGLTETASQVATARREEAIDHPGTVGRPLPGVEITVLDDGRQLSPDEPGELVVSGSTVAAGYYGNDRATADRFTAAGFRTRDRGYRDEVGRLWVLGRLDDAILTGGETVQPEPIEAALRADGAVGDAAVVGLPDPEWGERVAALVVPAEPGDIDLESLRDRCRERLEPPAVPTAIGTVTELPRTASGTVDRSAVRDRLRDASRLDGL